MRDDTVESVVTVVWFRSHLEMSSDNTWFKICPRHVCWVRASVRTPNMSLIVTIFLLVLVTQVVSWIGKSVLEDFVCLFIAKGSLEIRLTSIYSSVRYISNFSTQNFALVNANSSRHYCHRKQSCSPRVRKTTLQDGPG
jgi:hypothetical protein